MKRFVLLIVFLLIGRMAAKPANFEDLRLQAKGRSISLSSDNSFEAVVVSDYRSPNMELNPNISQSQVDLGENLRTAYVQSLDGRYGFRLRFSGIYENRLSKNSHVRINPEGCLLTGQLEPECYTIEGIRMSNIEILDGDVNVTPKRKRIGELTDDDLYTLVTLEQVEFSQKQGSYANVYEGVVQSSWVNAFSRPLRFVDGWASLLKDSENRDIYMLVNTKCTWRRGTRVPGGSGSITGIVVHTPMRRYGGNMGRYSIRPRDEEDIVVSDDSSTSYYQTIVEWNWNDNKAGIMRLEDPDSAGSITNRILADVGTGFLSTDSGAKLRFDTEYDVSGIQDGGGMRKNGALRLDSETRKWFELDKKGHLVNVRSILIECATEGLSGRGICFDFSFVAGNHDINRSWGFPVDWKIEYSIDGNSFMEVDRRFILRPVVYTNRSMSNVGHRQLSYDAALGFTEYSVPLPISLLGQKRVVIKLSPASLRLAAIPDNPSEDSATGEMTEKFNHPFVLRLGSAALKILK